MVRPQARLVPGLLRQRRRTAATTAAIAPRRTRSGRVRSATAITGMAILEKARSAARPLARAQSASAPVLVLLEKMARLRLRRAWRPRTTLTLLPTRGLRASQSRGSMRLALLSAEAARESAVSAAVSEAVAHPRPAAPAQVRDRAVRGARAAPEVHRQHGRHRPRLRWRGRHPRHERRAVGSHAGRVERQRATCKRAEDDLADRQWQRQHRIACHQPVRSVRASAGAENECAGGAAPFAGDSILSAEVQPTAKYRSGAQLAARASRSRADSGKERTSARRSAGRALADRATWVSPLVVSPRSGTGSTAPPRRREPRSGRRRSHQAISLPWQASGRTPPWMSPHSLAFRKAKWRNSPASPTPSASPTSMANSSATALANPFGQNAPPSLGSIMGGSPALAALYGGGRGGGAPVTQPAPNSGGRGVGGGGSIPLSL